MSLQKAKQIADLKDEIAVYSKQLTAMHNGFRKSINDDVVSNFCSYLSVNDFDVNKTNDGAEASYKGLSVKLKLPKPDERYMGIYHSFDVIVDGKKHDVTVLVSFEGGSENRPIGDSIEALEATLQGLKHDVANLKLVQVKFDCAQRIPHTRVQPVYKQTIAEVLDTFLA